MAAKIIKYLRRKTRAEHEEEVKNFVSNKFVLKLKANTKPPFWQAHILKVYTTSGEEHKYLPTGNLFALRRHAIKKPNFAGCSYF